MWKLNHVTTNESHNKMAAAISIVIAVKKIVMIENKTHNKQQN